MTKTPELMDDTKKAPKKKPNKVLTVFLNLGLVAVLLLSLEGYGWLHVSLMGSEYNHSWRFHHVPKSSHSEAISDLHFVDPEFAGAQRWWNKQGWLESDDVQPEKPPGVYRIFYVGDSFVEGLVRSDETLSAVIEKRFNDETTSGKPIEFELINAGVSSYSPVLYYVWVRYHIMNYDPDLIVVNVDMTDDFDDWKYRLTMITDSDGNPLAVPPRDIFASEFIDTEKGPIKADFSSRLRLFLLTHSYFFTYLSYIRGTKIVDDLEEEVAAGESDAQIYQRWAWCREEWDPFVQQNVGFTFDILRRLADLCHRNGVKLMLTAVPHYPQYAANLNGEGKPPWSARPHFEFSQLADEIGVPYLNSYEALAPHVRGKPRNTYYYVKNVHFNPRGYVIWAAAHYEFLIDPANNLLPQSYYAE